MKFNQLMVPAKNYALSVFVLGFLFSLSSCSKNISFPVSPIVPAAEASAKVDKTNNGDYLVNLEVLNLASPQRLSPAKSHYLVWIETEDQGTRNLGEIKRNRGIFANKNKSVLKVETPFRPTQILITAEDNLNTQRPGNQLVIRSEPFRIR